MVRGPFRVLALALGRGYHVAMLESLWDTHLVWSAIVARFNWENTPLMRTITVAMPMPLTEEQLEQLVGDSPVPYMRVASAEATPDGRLQVVLERMPFSGAA